MVLIYWRWCCYCVTKVRANGIFLFRMSCQGALACWVLWISTKPLTVGGRWKDAGLSQGTNYSLMGKQRVSVCITEMGASWGASSDFVSCECVLYDYPSVSLQGISIFRDKICRCFSVPSKAHFRGLSQGSVVSGWRENSLVWEEDRRHSQDVVEHKVSVKWRNTGDERELSRSVNGCCSFWGSEKNQCCC